MDDPGLINALIQAGALEKIRAQLDAHPEAVGAQVERSWLAQAAGNGQLDIMEELYRRGLRPNEVGTDGLHPLEAGAEYPEVVQWLLDRGADATVPGVMVSAASRADAATIRKLLAAGGDVTVRTGRRPRNAYEQAQRMGRPQEILDLLRPPPGAFDAFRWLEGRLGPLEMPKPPLAPSGSPVSLVLAPSKDKVVVTTLGLSAQALPGLDYRAEVLVRLPPKWPSTTALGKDPQWPVEWLLSVVHAALTRPVLKDLDTIGNGEPPERLSADVPFVGSITIDEEHDATLPDGTPVKLFSLIPLHPNELAVARRDPMELIQAFEDAKLPDEPVITAKRRSTVGS